MSENTQRLSQIELQAIGRTIHKQIGIWSLAEVGARGFAYGYFTLQGEKQLPGFRFTAKPTTRLVDVYVLLEPSDTYRVIVRKRNTYEPVTLWELDGVYADMLAEIIRDLPKKLTKGA